MDNITATEPVNPDSIDLPIDKETSETSLSKAEQDKIQCELDSNRLALSHRKWIVGILIGFAILLYGIFIWAVLYVILAKEFTPYTLIPISLAGIIPTAIGISIVRGIYPLTKETNDDLSKMSPAGLVGMLLRNVAPPHQ